MEKNHVIFLFSLKFEYDSNYNILTMNSQQELSFKAPNITQKSNSKNACWTHSLRLLTKHLECIIITELFNKNKFSPSPTITSSNWYSTITHQSRVEINPSRTKKEKRGGICRGEEDQRMNWNIKRGNEYTGDDWSSSSPGFDQRRRSRDGGGVFVHRSTEVRERCVHRFCA